MAPDVSRKVRKFSEDVVMEGAEVAGTVDPTTDTKADPTNVKLGDTSVKVETVVWWPWLTPRRRQGHPWRTVFQKM